MRVVTIDGPAGAGKSTVARRVAERLGWRFLDTGAMYRAVTLAALRLGLDLGDDEAIDGLVASLEVRLPPGRVLLGGEDVGAAIRDPRVTRATGQVADRRNVRACLVHWQRAFAAEYDTITEGRDQGTIVFPNALVKFFLTASLDERARRRHRDLQARGDGTSLSDVVAEIRERDARDEARAIAPLRPAEDAILVETTDSSIEEIVARLLAEIRRRLEDAPHGD
jgi:cytidylate kinase